MINPYNFLPFMFRRLGKKFLLTNDVGNYCFVNDDQFNNFLNKTLQKDSNLYFDLISKNFIYNSDVEKVINSLSIAYKTKKKNLYDFTSLHMLVVTHRCNQKCSYCHATSESEDSGNRYDMDISTALKCVDMAFKSPSKHIKFEFQGGEPLLNFEVVKNVVEYANSLAAEFDKKLQFVICTNLTLINQNHLDFINENDVFLSTSLDGPKKIHDQCRKFRNGTGTYDVVIEKLRMVQDISGPDKVSALVTISTTNLNNFELVIDEYISAGLPSIFLRMLNPHGLAHNDWQALGYCVDDFIKNYKKSLDYIIKINREGIFFPEEFATILLRRILTPFATGFVDLQSPSGAGISAVAYETNGDVYVADEGRMLAKNSGDKTFCIGNVKQNNFNQVFCSDKLIEIARQSTIEAVPGCAWCAYQPYCGCDPIRNYIQFGTFGTTNSQTDFCHKHKSLFDIFFDHLHQEDDATMDVFWSWIEN
jgi:uncharacterized protein